MVLAYLILDWLLVLMMSLSISKLIWFFVGFFLNTGFLVLLEALKGSLVSKSFIMIVLKKIPQKRLTNWTAGLSYTCDDLSLFKKFQFTKQFRKNSPCK